VKCLNGPASAVPPAVAPLGLKLVRVAAALIGEVCAAEATPPGPPAVALLADSELGAAAPLAEKSLRATALATGEQALSAPLEFTAVTAAKYVAPVMRPVSVVVAV
jgi:hypothetical protein